MPLFRHTQVRHSWLLYIPHIPKIPNSSNLICPWNQKRWYLTISQHPNTISREHVLTSRGSQWPFPSIWLRWILLLRTGTAGGPRLWPWWNGPPFLGYGAPTIYYMVKYIHLVDRNRTSKLYDLKSFTPCRGTVPLTTEAGDGLPWRYPCIERCNQHRAPNSKVRDESE